jgi:hypothetical protein
VADAFENLINTCFSVPMAIQSLFTVFVSVLKMPVSAICGASKTSQGHQPWLVFAPCSSLKHAFPSQTLRSLP